MSRSPTSKSGGGAGLFDAGLAPDQIKAGDALAALKPLLESAGILKIGFNIKFNAVMLAQHGVTLRNHRRRAIDVLRAGCRPQRARAGRRWPSDGSATPCIDYGDLIGSGKNKLTFDQVAIDKATDLFGRRVPT